MSVLFDASSEFLSRASSLPGFASFTVCGWTKVSSYTADKHMVFRAVPTGATGGATLYFQLQDSGGSTLQIGFWSGSVNSAGAFASRPAPGDWFFWYVRALGTGAGQLQAGWRRASDASFVTQSATLSTYSSWATWEIFAQNGSASTVNGLGARVKTWGVALTDTELLAEMLASSPVKTANIDSFLPLDNSSSATWGTDQSGAGHNWTVSSSPTFDSARPPTAFSLTADSGTFSLSGKTAALKVGRGFAAGSGSFALAGQPAALHRGYTMAAGSGGFGLTGQPATLRVGRRLSADPGAFTLTGSDANLNVGANKRMTADPGVFGLTGGDATLRVARRMSAGSGAISLTGTAAALRYGRVLPAGSGAFAMNGQAATLTYVRHLVLNAEAGSFLLRGSNVRFGLNDHTITAPPLGAKTVSAGALSGRTATASPRVRRTITAEPIQ